MKTKFYAPVEAVNPTDKEKVEAWATDRGLAGKCEKNGKHGWLFLPKEEEQKQYLICIHCLEPSHT